MLRGILRRENPTYTYWSLPRGVVLKWFNLRPTAAATRGFTMVSFTEAVSRRNTFVGGTCAPPSALLVAFVVSFLVTSLGLTCSILTCSTCSVIATVI